MRHKIYPPCPAFGRELREKARHMGFNTSQLAAVTGFSIPTMSKVLNGQRVLYPAEAVRVGRVLMKDPLALLVQQAFGQLKELEGE